VNRDPRRVERPFHSDLYPTKRRKQRSVGFEGVHVVKTVADHPSGKRQKSRPREGETKIRKKNTKGERPGNMDRE